MANHIIGCICGGIRYIADWRRRVVNVKTEVKRAVAGSEGSAAVEDVEAAPERGTAHRESVVAVEKYADAPWRTGKMSKADWECQQTLSAEEKIADRLRRQAEAKRVKKEKEEREAAEATAETKAMLEAVLREGAAEEDSEF